MALKPLLDKKLDLSVIATHLAESTIWFVLLILIMIIRQTHPVLATEPALMWLSGLIVIFILLYYSLVHRYFDGDERHYLKALADVIFIGVLATIAHDYSIYLFSLFILPIIASAFTLNSVHALSITIVALLFITGNTLMGTTDFKAPEPVYFNTFLVGLLSVLILFIRAVAVHLQDDQRERQFFEERLREVDQKLQNVEAIEQEFVSITTHQLNTPLSIIRGYTSMLLGGDAGKLSTKQTRYVKEVHTGSLRLIKIIRNLLDITHLDRDKVLKYPLQPIQLQSIIQQSVDVLGTKAKAHKIRFETKMPDSDLSVMGNLTQLQQIVNNLADNALKYSDPNSTITITLSEEKADKNGRNAVISVHDQGIGIPKEEQSRIFQRFYRATNTRSKDPNGTGLGLYIVKRIVEGHGGSVSFVSQVNEGTTFKVRLPLAQVGKK